MTNDDYVGKIVTLKPDFVKAVSEVDSGVPTKVTRPYLIVGIPTKKHGQQLFAIPMQTSVHNMNDMFFEKLSPRLETWPSCDSGLVISQMIPVNTAVIEGVKGGENLIPYEYKKRQAIIHNLKTFGENDIPVKVRPEFNMMKKMANTNGDIFANPSFRKAYKNVSNEIFKESIRIKNANFQSITKKAEDYLRYYVKFLLQNKKFTNPKNGTKIGLPYLHSEIDKVVKFVNAKYVANKATVKTSLQQDPLQEKYKLTAEQFAAAKKLAEKENASLEKTIQKNIMQAPDGIFDAAVKAQIIAQIKAERRTKKQKPETKTQEKIAPKTVKKNNAQNSR